MNPNYKELYEKYKILKEENKRLRDEVGLLRRILSKEESETRFWLNSHRCKSYCGKRCTSLILVHTK